jgi:very-short-patch-repair endonuclease
MRDKRVVNPDEIVARIAARQHGLVTIGQLHLAGLDKSAVARRVAAGRLHRVFRGVYAVGHAGLGNEGRWMAAVLACGDGAALSHRSAAELWRLLDPADGPIHVIVPVAGGRRGRDGLRIHRVPSLPTAATTRRDGIAVTTPARTLADLRTTLSHGELRTAVRQAEFLGLPIDPHALVPDRTSSELERLFLRLVRRHRLPAAEVNARIAGLEVDFLWREQRLIVETDGYHYHRGSVAFEDDRARDNRLMSCGYDVLRFTYKRVVDEPDAVVALVRARLTRAFDA